MRVLTALFLLAVASRAAEVKSFKNKKEEGRTEKRELEEGNAGVEKRTVVLSTAAPGITPGVEYADSTETLADKSPAQQVYSTPVPRIAKISDVLTGQGPPFQAIANHLYSPISVYQARLASPTTYEVSAPVPSQLAYSEHKLYQPHNIPFAPQLYNHKFQAKSLPRLDATYNNVPQQIFVQDRVSQPIYQHFPDIYHSQIYNPPQFFQPNQAYHGFVQSTVQPGPAVHPGITYAQEKVPLEAKPQPQIQVELKTSEPTKVTESRAPPAPSSRNYNQESHGAVSFASFSQSPPPQQTYSQKVAPTAPTPYLPYLQQEPVKQIPQPVYFRQSPGVPIQFNHQLYQSPGYLSFNNGPLPAPTFPPVQYFGKFAHSIFGGYHH